MRHRLGISASGRFGPTRSFIVTQVHLGMHACSNVPHSSKQASQPAELNASSSARGLGLVACLGVSEVAARVDARAASVEASAEGQKDG